MTDHTPVPECESGMPEHIWYWTGGRSLGVSHQKTRDGTEYIRKDVARREVLAEVDALLAQRRSNFRLLVAHLGLDADVAVLEVLTQLRREIAALGGGE